MEAQPFFQLDRGELIKQFERASVLSLVIMMMVVVVALSTLELG